MDASEGKKMDNLSVLEGEAAHCWGRNVVASPSQETQGSSLAACCYKLLKESPHSSSKNIPTVTSHQKPAGCVFPGVHRSHTHTDRHTHFSETNFPQRSCALTGKVRGVGNVFFLLPVENGGEFYDPCSLSSCKNHTSSFPGLQHHRPRRQWKQRSVWRRNKANTGEGEKNVFLDGNTCSWIWVSSEAERLSLLLEERGFSGAITTGNLPEHLEALCFAAAGSFGSSPRKMHQCRDPPHVCGQPDLVFFKC